MQSIHAKWAGLASAILFVSACASADLRAINRVAAVNVTALATTTAAYDAARDPQINATSNTLFEQHDDGPIPRGELQRIDAESVQYQSYVATLRAHAALLSAYFAALADATAPGSNSATKNTDAQLAGSAGILAAINKLNPELARVTGPAATLLLNGLADQGIRANLTEYGPVIAEGLLIQRQAMAELETATAQNRNSHCNNLMYAFENGYAPRSVDPAHPPQRLTPAEIAQFLERRRTALTCTRGALEAQTAGIAMEEARVAFAALVAVDTRSEAQADQALAVVKQAQPLPPSEPPGS